MLVRKQLAWKSSILMLVATMSGLLVWSLRTWGADPEKGPRAFLQIGARAPGLSSTSKDNSEDYNDDLQTQFALIKSRLVINTALQQPAIAQLAAIRKQPDPIAWLKQYLDTSNVKNSKVVQVSLSPRCGASGTDQAAIINAVVRAYLEEVANVDIKRRVDRHSKLKKIKQTYREIIKERRESARKLSGSVGSDGHPSAAEQNSLAHRYERLLDQRRKLRLDRAAAETVLGRRQKAANRETDPVRKEIAQLEDRLAILTAEDKVLQDELSQAAGKKRSAVEGALDMKSLNDEIAQMEEAARKVGAEVETLNIELEAPPRVQIIDNAVPPK
jgi:succinoglycan biosynthesis transport protein ExoP